MEGLMSLPRSAKSGLAVLLAVALLGWAIVAYSAKRQHEDARSLERAVATLTSQEERAVAANLERKRLEQLLVAAETELGASRQAVEANRQEAGELETRLADLTAELTDAKEAVSQAEARAAASQEASSEAESLAADVQQAESRLEAAKAALQQREQELDKREQTLGDRQALLDDLEGQRDAIQTAISENRTQIGEQEETLASLAENIAEGKTLLAEQRQELGTIRTEIADLEAAREDGLAESSSLTAEIDGLEAALSDKQDGIAYAETELERLEADIARVEHELAAREAELRTRDATLDQRNAEVESVEASLEALKATRASLDTETADFEIMMDRQAELSEDLTALKGELDQTRTALASQESLLEQKRAEVDAVDARLRQAKDGGNPSIPIAALAAGDFAVLPVDPLDELLPVQTANGIRLTQVHFDLGSAELTPTGLRRAKDVAAWIKAQDAERITLVGATDTIGTRANNLALAERRARSLHSVLVAEGVDPARIELVARGEAGGSEVIGDQTAEPMNRRVGVFIERDS